MIITPLPEIGFIRLKQVLTLIRVSKATWYRGIKTGAHPKPYQLKSGVKAYDVADIRAYIEAEKNRQPINFLNRPNH